MLFKLGYPEQTQKALFPKYYLLNLDKIRAKMTVFNFIEKRQKSYFFLQDFFSAIIVAKPKVTIHSKIQSLFQLRSDFFCSYLFPGNIAFCPSAAWPCLDFQHHGCTSCQEIANFFFSYLYKIYCHSDLPRKFLACCHFQWSQILKYMPWQVKKFISSRIPTSFRSGHYFSSYTSNKQNSQTKLITLLASLRKWTLSYRQA